MTLVWLINKVENITREELRQKNLVWVRHLLGFGRAACHVIGSGMNFTFQGLLNAAMRCTKPKLLRELVVIPCTTLLLHNFRIYPPNSVLYVAPCNIARRVSLCASKQQQSSTRTAPGYVSRCAASAPRGVRRDSMFSMATRSYVLARLTLRLAATP
jgi:hypothetical protein